MARAMKVGATHDPAERKAEQAARQRPTHETASESAYAVPGSVERTVGGVGQPLDPSVRKDMSRRLAYDFSQVRIHADSAAERSADDISAAAYTVGNDIAFAPGRYEPTTQEGSRLLAHELAHVAQGDGATVRPYRDKKSQNFGVRDHGTLVEKPFNMATDRNKLPWIESVSVVFASTKTDANGSVYWIGNATATYFKNPAQLADLTFGIAGGSSQLGKSDAGNFTVHRIEGDGYNSGSNSGTAGVDYDPADREGPGNRYTKKDSAGDRPSNMSFAVFYNGGEALHAGPVDASSHGCIHVDWNVPDTIQQLNYHSVIGFTKVKVAYPKKP